MGRLKNIAKWVGDQLASKAFDVFIGALLVLGIGSPVAFLGGIFGLFKSNTAEMATACIASFALGVAVSIAVRYLQGRIKTWKLAELIDAMGPSMRCTLADAYAAGDIFETPRATRAVSDPSAALAALKRDGLVEHVANSTLSHADKWRLEPETRKTIAKSRKLREMIKSEERAEEIQTELKDAHAEAFAEARYYDKLIARALYYNGDITFGKAFYERMGNRVWFQYSTKDDNSRDYRLAYWMEVIFDERPYLLDFFECEDAETDEEKAKEALEAIREYAEEEGWI